MKGEDLRDIARRIEIPGVISVFTDLPALLYSAADQIEQTKEELDKHKRTELKKYQRRLEHAQKRNDVAAVAALQAKVDRINGFLEGEG